MKKMVAFLAILAFLSLSCAFKVSQLERKKEAGDVIEEAYDYNWEEVYDGMMYVWKHSDNWHISTRYSQCDLDFAKDEKVMFVKITQPGIGSGGMDMGIYFEPLGEYRTRVIFVKGGFAYAAWREETMRYLILETHFCLDHGKDAYREYTSEELKKGVKEIE